MSVAQADRVFFGTVLTFDGARPTARALALAGRRVLAVGEEAEIRGLIGPHTEVVDLGGRAVMPGFHDSHVHLTQHGIELAQLDLSATRSVDDALVLVREWATSQPPGAWILGSGFALQRWGLRGLGRAEAEALDAAAGDHPVLLRSQDHHSAWANRRALSQAGVDRDTPDPPQGTLARDGRGEPTGVLLERALHLVWDRVPRPDAAAVREALDRAAADLASRGITTVHHMAYEPAAYWRELALAATDPAYPLRVWACVPQEDIEHAAALGLATGQGGADFTVGGAKFFADGALGSRTAWMLEPYAGGEDRGVSVDGPEVLRERLPLAIAAGLTPVTHAIGDAANRAVLDALEATAPAWRARGLRPRIEHAQHIHPDDVARFGRLGVTASMQPIHLTFDVASIRSLLSERASRAYPMRSLRAAGVTLAFGSDTPVASPDVFAGLRAACRRRAPDGDVLTPSETLSPDQALAAYTAGAAHAIGRGGRSGRLLPGFDADLVVLSHDPLVSLNALEVSATIKGGRVTFGQDAL